MSKTMKSILEYLQSGFYTQKRTKNTLKVYLIYMFSIIGFFFTLILGFVGLYNENNTLAFFLLTDAFVLVLNFIYMKITGNYKVASYVILYFFFLLMIYLVYSGGVSNTGPLWTYSLPAMALFLHGFKKGLMEIFVFLFIVCTLFFYPDNALLAANYNDEFKVRIILTLLLVTFLSSVYEYSNDRSFDNMEKLREELEYASTRDQLTSLYNRRGYHKNLEKMRQKSHGAIIMCDIDNFKKVNDVYGHYAGDFTIQEVAKNIQNNLREDDIAVRWGGEEFFIFLSEVTLDNAYFVAEKLRKSIENLDIKYKDDIVINVTLSIGVAGLNDKNYLENAIGNADNAMYLSKTSGRNTTSRH